MSTPALTTPAAPLRPFGYGGFLFRALKLATDGSWTYYAWMTFLTAVWLTGAHAWAI